MYYVYMYVYVYHISEYPLEFSGCEIDLRAWGFSDKKPWNGWIKVNGEIQANISHGFQRSRGVNVLFFKQIPRRGCELIPGSFKNYDTFANEDESARFQQYVDKQQDGTIVLVASADEATGSDGGKMHILLLRCYEHALVGSKPNSITHLFVIS